MSYFAVALPVDEESELVDTHKTIELANSDLLHTTTTQRALNDTSRNSVELHIQARHDLDIT